MKDVPEELGQVVAALEWLSLSAHNMKDKDPELFEELDGVVMSFFEWYQEFKKDAVEGCLW